MTGASSLLWVRDVSCPKCKAEVGAPCRALTTGRATDHHVARSVALRTARRWAMTVKGERDV